jgi:preprotein translocase subunit SecD
MVAGYHVHANVDRGFPLGARTLLLFRRAEVTSESITDVAIGQDQQNFGQYFVSLTFSPAGADHFAEVTGANINRRFAIILDDRVDSAPVIRSQITGGHAQITMGAGDPEKQLRDAHQLDLVLLSGALPAPSEAALPKPR